IPVPMTLETTMAAASKGPSRRSRDGEGWALTRAVPASLRNELSGDRHLPHVRPLRRPVLRDELYERVDELGILQHVGARVGAGIAERRFHGQRRRGCARREPLRPGDVQETVAPL